MYCTNCGSKLADNARFCSECGAPTGVAKKVEYTESRCDERDYTEPRYDETDYTEPRYDETEVDEIKGAAAQVDEPKEDTYEKPEKARTMGYSGATDRAQNDYASYAERRDSGNLYSSYIAQSPLVTERSTGITILSFLIPLVGLILWLVWKNSKPGKAISAAKGALISVCVGAPIVGLILWATMKDTNAELAKPCGISAIVGVVLAFLLPFVIFFALIIYSLLFSYEGYYAALALAAFL